MPRPPRSTPGSTNDGQDTVSFRRPEATVGCLPESDAPQLEPRDRRFFPQVREVRTASGRRGNPGKVRSSYLWQ